MAVWAQGDAVLPDTIEAIVGRLFHAARDAVLKGGLVGPDRADEVRHLIEVLKTAEEERLATVEGCSGLPPLDRSIGRRRWIELSAGLVSWARSIRRTTAFSRRDPAPARASDRDLDDEDAISFGAEQRWTSKDLRLRGRPDESAIATDGVVEVTDYKTGHVLDHEGQLRPSVITQVQLYLLMAEVLTGRSARGRVVSDRTTPVPWGDSEREALKARLSTISDTFPIAARLLTVDVARAGPHCIGCRLRPRCPTYLETVPQWWSDGRAHPRPLPFDTWGTVTSYEAGDAITIRLDDAGGRSVIVRGLQHAHGLDPACVGTQLFIFTLQPSEELNLHGLRLHPQAFHECSPGPRWSSARQVVTYAPENEPVAAGRSSL